MSAVAFPVFLPRSGVAVSSSTDPRSYQQIADAVATSGTLTKLQQMEAEPEADFDSAALVTRDQQAPTWLGLSRDSRLFKIAQALDGNGLEQDVIRITRGSTPMPLPELRSKFSVYGYAEGRGQSAIVDVQTLSRRRCAAHPAQSSPGRRCSLPHDIFCFARAVSAERALTCAARISWSRISTTAETRSRPSKRPKLPKFEPRLRIRRRSCFTCELRQRTPRAFRATPGSRLRGLGRCGMIGQRMSSIRTPGLRSFLLIGYFVYRMLDGRPLPQEEMAVLLQPGQTATFDCRLPHQPLSQARATDLAGQNFEVRLCRVSGLLAREARGGGAYPCTGETR